MSEKGQRKEEERNCETKTEKSQNGETDLRETRTDDPPEDLDSLAGISEAEQKRRENIRSAYNRAVEQAYEQARAEADRTETTDQNIRVTVTAVGTIIGRGHHSNVYRAEMTGSKEPVALKVDYRNLMKEYPRVWGKVKALREIGKSGNEHIQRLIEFVPDWEKNRSYMILAYVPGETLQKTLYDRTQNGGAPFPQKRGLNWTLQILDALDYLHKHRLLHGDINLSNIMLRPKKGNKDEEEHDICLIDFNWSAPDLEAGEVRADIQSDDPTDIQFEKAQHAKDFQRGIRRDIYHVGAVMYQLLTGEVPDLDKGRAELLDKEKKTEESEKRRNLREHGVTDDVAEVILKAISVDPQKRYRSAGRMRDALTALPRKNSGDDKKNKPRKIILFSRLCALLGVILITLGVSLNSHFQNMKDYAAQAETAFAQGKYTDALRLARDAVGSHMPTALVPAEGQDALTRILGHDQVGAGYRPWASLSVEDGFPVRVRLSRDGNWLVVLLKQNAEDAETYRICAYSMSESKVRTLSAVSGLDDFDFGGNHTILYAHENRLICYDLNSGKPEWDISPPPEVNDAAPIALAVSGNQTKAAVLYPESDRVYLYNTPNGTPLETVSLDETPRELRKRMFLLDEKGDALAISFSGSSVGAYDISDGKAERFENIALTEIDNNYTDYEGGFYQSWLLFTASVTYDDGETRGERHRFDLDAIRDGANEDVYHMESSDMNPYRVRTDENGMFLSVGHSYIRVTDAIGRWGPSNNMEGEIILLEHTPDDNGGRLLTGIRREVSVLDGTGAELTRLTTPGANLWNLGVLSSEWLVLTGTDYPILSILRWTPKGVPDDVTGLKAMRKEADEWWNDLSEWNRGIEGK